MVVGMRHILFRILHEKMILRTMKVQQKALIHSFLNSAYIIYLSPPNFGFVRSTMSQCPSTLEPLVCGGG